MTVFAVTPSFAQWGVAAGPPPTTFYNGYTGIGPFNNITPFLADRMLHVHSTNLIAGGGFYPAYLRLQTQIPDNGVSGFNTFGETGIEFFSGSRLNGARQWCVGKILGISSGHGLLSSDKYELGFPPTDFRGGIAFYCSPPSDNTMPTENDQIEVMRIVDEKVGIRTITPLGALDVNVGTLNYNLPKISFTSGATTADASPGPQIRLYSPSANEGSPDRFDSYSWYIQSLRQYESACFAGLEGVTDGTDNHITQGALHFRSGYNPTIPSPTDIYRSNIGTENSIARMSLLSNGNVGINNEIPMVRFQVTNGAVLFEGTQGTTPLMRVVGTDGITANPAQIGEGTRLMWIPNKAAFRAGIIDGFNEGQNGGTASTDPDWVPSTNSITMSNKIQGWFNSNIGYYSFAFGHNSRALSSNDIAMGLNNVANSGGSHGSVAIGHANRTSGEDAFSIGFANRALHAKSICLGYECLTSAPNSIAIGFNCKTQGSESVSIGTNNVSGGGQAFTFGSGAIATNNLSFSIGENTSSESDYSFCLGRNLRSTAFNAYAIGYGATYYSYFRNYQAGSVMFSSGSELPSLVLTAGAGSDVGYVGIKTKTPCASFAIEGNAMIGENWAGDLDKTPPANSLVVQDKVGIGTYYPEEALSVNGKGYFWETGYVDLMPDVSLATEYKVVIGRSTVIAPDENTLTNQETMLHVGGRAIKNDGDSDWDNPSDKKLKKDIKPYSEGLSQLRKIHPVWFRYKNEWGLTDEKANIGVIAQEIREILPYTVREDTIKLSRKVKDEKRYSVVIVDTVLDRVPVIKPLDSTTQNNYKETEYKDTTVYKTFTRWKIDPPETVIESNPILTFNGSSLKYLLINSVKELDSTISTVKDNFTAKTDRLQEINDSLTKVIGQLESRLSRLESEKQIPLDGELDVILEQNNPNPFADITTITYYIPGKVQGNTELVIAPATTQSPILQKYPLTKGTPTQLIISAKDLYTGVFVYSITINGKVLVSKKFIIIK